MASECYKPENLSFFFGKAMNERALNTIMKLNINSILYSDAFTF